MKLPPDMMSISFSRTTVSSRSFSIGIPALVLREKSLALVSSSVTRIFKSFGCLKQALQPTERLSTFKLFVFWISTNSDSLGLELAPLVYETQQPGFRPELAEAR
ncbi:unnamed protein product [Dovyalis caffra]|uniref:Uncharacterized protein n=1 Tax=Dovyalis caffra TaxID=77055 RepID=A0AAV1QNB0_9ROSI|nr:unnamed protein product [Dovyalis caffra]